MGGRREGGFSWFKKDSEGFSWFQKVSEGFRRVKKKRIKHLKLRQHIIVL